MPHSWEKNSVLNRSSVLLCFFKYTILHTINKYVKKFNAIKCLFVPFVVQSK